MQRRRLRGRPLLKVKIGLGALSLVSMIAFPGCNLLPPPECDGGEPSPCDDLDAAPPPTDASRDGA
jgi:hypothetical protein